MKSIAISVNVPLLLAIFTCFHIYLSLYTSLSLFLFLSLFLSLSLSIYIYIYIYMCACVCVCVCVCVFTIYFYLSSLSSLPHHFYRFSYTCSRWSNYPTHCTFSLSLSLSLSWSLIWSHFSSSRPLSFKLKLIRFLDKFRFSRIPFFLLLLIFSFAFNLFIYP